MKTHSTTSAQAQITALYARQRELQDMEYLTSGQRAELASIPRDLAKLWPLRRIEECRARCGSPRTLTTGPSPLDQAYGDR